MAKTDNLSVINLNIVDLLSANYIYYITLWKLIYWISRSPEKQINYIFVFHCCLKYIWWGWTFPLWMIHETRARPTAYYSPFTRLKKKKKSHLVSLNCKESLNFVFTGGFLFQEDSFCYVKKKSSFFNKWWLLCGGGNLSSAGSLILFCFIGVLIFAAFLLSSQSL